MIDKRHEREQRNVTVAAGLQAVVHAFPGECTKRGEIESRLVSPARSLADSRVELGHLSQTHCSRRVAGDCPDQIEIVRGREILGARHVQQPLYKRQVGRRYGERMRGRVLDGVFRYIKNKSTIKLQV